jgi:hypothetical protein
VAGAELTGLGRLPPVNFDLNRATTVDKVVAVATFITMISIWMPWFTVSYLGASGSGSGTAAHGWLWLEFILALALIAYLVARVAWDTMPISLPVAHAPLLIVGTAVQLLLILIAFFDLPSSGGVAGVSVGWGFRRLPRPARRAGRGGSGPLPGDPLLPGQPQALAPAPAHRTRHFIFIAVSAGERPTAGRSPAPFSFLRSRRLFGGYRSSLDRRAEGIGRFRRHCHALRRPRSTWLRSRS